ncbi:hypothetical protein ACIBG8_26855 [Nonomuraea sp. NPDC050556]|uniref:hypothetical protein n=1 Tax=Nonomuraea sp. NPDC050556 TaxID=3364369 RepID=UPI003788FFBF
MTYTEDDLRVLLTERTEAGPSGRGPDMAGIVRRGRRIKATRWTATAALAGAAAVAVYLGIPSESPAANVARPTVTASGFPSLEVPRTLDGLPQVTRMTVSAMGVGEDLVFRPRSTLTRLMILCRDLTAWVVADVGDRGGEVTRCADGKATITLKAADLPATWTRKEQKLHIWVFPSESPIEEGSLDGCAVPDEEKGMCDGRYAAQELLRYEVALDLAATLSARPGPWSVGVYDSP